MSDRPHDPDRLTVAMEALEDMVRQFGYLVVKNGTPCLSTGGLGALEYAFEVLGWDDPHPVPENRCEHPGCPEWATRGMPTPDGYKRLCFDHAEEVRR